MNNIDTERKFMSRMEFRDYFPRSCVLDANSKYWIHHKSINEIYEKINKAGSKNRRRIILSITMAKQPHFAVVQAIICIKCNKTDCKHYPKKVPIDQP